jgi:hypothetical protein
LEKLNEFEENDIVFFVKWSMFFKYALGEGNSSAVSMCEG